MLNKTFVIKIWMSTFMTINFEKIESTKWDYSTKSRQIVRAVWHDQSLFFFFFIMRINDCSIVNNSVNVLILLHILFIFHRFSEHLKMSSVRRSREKSKIDLKSLKDKILLKRNTMKIEEIII